MPYKADKKRTTVVLSKETLEYVERKIQDHTFASVSHGIELALARYREREERERRDQEQKGGERDRARRYGMIMVPPAMVVKSFQLRSSSMRTSW